MDIFVRNIPAHSTNKQLERLLEGPLKECGVTDYDVDNWKGKPQAKVTVLNAAAGQRFLQTYGVARGAPSYAHGLKPLRWDGVFVQCSQDRNGPSAFALKSLAYSAAQKAASVPGKASTHQKEGGGRVTRFSISELQCGVWDYDAKGNLAFMTHYRNTNTGSVIFGHKQAIVLLGPTTSDHIRVDLNYYGSEHIVLGSRRDDATITIGLGAVAPKMYKVHGEDVLSAQLTRLVISSAAAQSKDVMKLRLIGIDNEHERIAGVCFVYRMTLADPAMLGTVSSLMKHTPKMPPVMHISTSLAVPTESWRRSKMRLDYELTDVNRLGGKSFSIRFQLDRIVRNGMIPPTRLLELLPTVDRIHAKYGADATFTALARFSRQMPVAGPDTDANELSKEALERLLEDFVVAYDPHAPANPYELTKRHAHINLVHKIVVTPTGTYLEGPDPEPTNRVLRKYSRQADHFVRVLFRDEDGSSVHYDPRASQEIIYHTRFKGVLDATINIAGQAFAFLGFSHSSLRSQSCWFMAPLFDTQKGSLLYAPQVIKELGDFTHIRTPAKCAARIGQCFTDTTASVTLQSGENDSLSVVARNGRDFSDGVGTISRRLLEDVWRVYGQKQQLKPTALQIRFQGAKGMVSLDSRLQGRRLLLRSNMMKFGGSESQVLEICGAAFRPLPMVLNRQFIKILEDLGVHTDVFLQLQNEQVDELRCMLTSARNTASLLDTLEMTKATRLSSLINDLHDIGLDYHTDYFLYGVVEMAVISRLRDIKYRGRIDVSEGVTLYGIMDETGYLKQGQVYVVTERGPDGGRHEILRNTVIVTRSPAMHPGDIQVVNAVDVPENSPLKKLSNVVVFSQHGDRDLPSMLSGGDLDGDLYNIIWDKRLRPKLVATPADYPKVSPVELDRAVTAKDMSDFFVTFMETDQLGMICTRHMQLADQEPDGTFSVGCIKLAGMASTAVDYSKTGIPINIREAPRYDPRRPDFMAPSPRVVVSEKGYLDLEEDDNQDDEAFEGIDTEQKPWRYYKSDKALGHLYRAIDEHHFLTTMQNQHRALALSSGDPSSMLPTLLKHIQKCASTYGVNYTHALPLAKDIRDSYDESLLDIMYNYCPTLHTHLSEQEVFSGTILGRQGGAQGKSIRELSKTMRERFEAVTEYAVLRITRGDQATAQGVTVVEEEQYEGYDDREIEGLPRAIACLEVAVRERGWVDRKAGELRSFGYVAAGVCLRELRRYMITTFGRNTLQRV
ncbi:hypothetical protein LTR12_000570 [Friedmanniomyces endolithicus]|nr:hypothetical protein LTR12_000570 [Friedmanniomyces endolithicus]